MCVSIGDSNVEMETTFASSVLYEGLCPLSNIELITRGILRANIKEFQPIWLYNMRLFKYHVHQKLIGRQPIYHIQKPTVKSPLELNLPGPTSYIRDPAIRSLLEPNLLKPTHHFHNPPVRSRLELNSPQPTTYIHRLAIMSPLEPNLSRPTTYIHRPTVRYPLEPDSVRLTYHKLAARRLIQCDPRPEAKPLGKPNSYLILGNQPPQAHKGHE
ncbi:hypothetical protein AMTR_s00046p00161940 [Amborella trichopoda]|uniref:Uncharacterized protein n=1 Tax=Amborella trichopoda TaxID=13333 RepID=U5D708_AMBTC|nr:hypothetical protein AMTR_s00046p00161940 [Amborella trichopoda]